MVHLLAPGHFQTKLVRTTELLMLVAVERRTPTRLLIVQVVMVVLLFSGKPERVLTQF
jgi:hypothetical protein